MQVPNAWRRLQVALATVCLVIVAGCSGGAPTTQNASASPGTTSGGNTNKAPVIGGQPGTALQAGQTYSFQPAASDANGDALTFSVTGLPAWSSFNSSTGRLTGTPGAAHVGSYNAITITVSDGKAHASLAPFDITVTAAPAANPGPLPVGTGAATLTWVAPTTNVDGTALRDLAGYQVLYGTSADALTQVIAISNPSVSTYVVENLGAATWYFAVVAVNATGNTSAQSNVASKQIS